MSGIGIAYAATAMSGTELCYAATSVSGEEEVPDGPLAVAAYALATRCPVLTYRMLSPAYALAMRCAMRCPVLRSRMVLPGRSRHYSGCTGTCLPYGAVCYRIVLYVPIDMPYGAMYAMASTDLPYPAIHTLPGTGLAYGPTRVLCNTCLGRYAATSVWY
eukprot:242128-Rhodomonas_salina.3